MEKRNGPGRTAIVGGCRKNFGRKKESGAPRGFCPLAALWLALLCAQAAPIQLMSAGSGPLIDMTRTNVGGTVPAQSIESFGRMPLMFEAADSGGSRFFCRGSGYHLWLSSVETVLALKQTRNRERGAWNEQAGFRSRWFPAPPSRNSVADAPPLRIKFIGANAAAQAAGLEQLPTQVNYFLGNDPGQWRRGVPTFGKVCYQNVYPGIDLVYYGNQRQLEYDFVVAPGASAGLIALQFDGVEKLEVDADGDLILQTGSGAVRQRCPIIYQEFNGRRKEVSGRYVLGESADREVGFEIALYDQSRPLIIDPVLVYSSYLGGLGFDRAWDIAVDTNGCAYVVGETASTNFPTSTSLYPTNSSGLSDVFVAKLGSAGTNLVFSTYLGGNGIDIGFGIALDSGGNVYLTGVTTSTNFPVTTNAVSTNLNSAAYFGHYTNDAFVVKLDSTGARLLFSTYLGGSGADVGSAISVDGGGNVYVTGETQSPDFPTNAVSPPFGGSHDAFVVKLTASDSNLVYSTFLGGSGDDRGQSVAVDSSGNAIVVGVTASVDFPVVNAIQTNFAGGLYDIFVTKLSSDGATKQFSTYLGDSGDDEAFRVALDGAGYAYLTGLSTSTNFAALTNFPSASMLNTNQSGGEDAFVMKLDPNGTNVIYWTYLGGVSNDEGWSIAVDNQGNAYVVGRTSSTNFPAVNAYQSTLGGLNDVFVARLNASGTALDYSTYLGGLFADEGYGIAVDNAGNAYISGMTASTDFPVYPATNGVQTAFGGGSGDAFVAKLFPRNAELRAQLSGSSDVMIFWPYGLQNFELQSSDSLNGTNTSWITVTNPPTVAGGDNAITFSNTTSNMFFRLRRTP